MNKAQPIRKQEDLEHFKNYYGKEGKGARNQLLLTIGLNTALRISDILSLQWKDVYDFSGQKFLQHITLVEHKTKKYTCIYVNQSVKEALVFYRDHLEESTRIEKGMYLFAGQNGEPISRVQAYRIIRRAAEGCNLSGVVSPHSLRKTFGYHAWKQGVEPALLMDIYNHSSFAITQRYLGIEQDDRDDVFRNICL